MDLSKIKTLIDFVGQSAITELTVTEKDTTVRIFRTRTGNDASVVPVGDPSAAGSDDASRGVAQGGVAEDAVLAPIFGVLHCAPSPGERAFIAAGDRVEAGQTLFIIEAMKVFNTISASRSGRIARILAVDGAEVEAGDVLAEIA